MDFTVGILLVLAGGALEGLFSLGVTRTPKWRWENIWGLGSLVALVLIPWPVALLTVPGLGGVLHNASWTSIIMALLFGIGWGRGGVFWGLGIDAVGVALGVSMLMGITSVFGALGPLLIQNPGKLLEPSGLVLSLGLLVMVVGVVIVSAAGRKKESDLRLNQPAPATATRTARAFAVGLIFCIVSGVLSPLVNFAFNFGTELKEAAVQAGASPSAQNNAIWALVFTGNYLVNFLYAAYLMAKNKSIGQFSQGDSLHWFWAAFLGISWPLGIVLFGIGADRLGQFGGYAGFPLMLLFAIFFSNLAGALTGEWRGTRPATRTVMVVGVLVLLSATVLLATANRLATATPSPPVKATLHLVETW
ncbi:MAG: hypothetical protein M1608_04055 [Candidatus Omnitrophica bacterium]|nr:hypothetical protein [Candidatus Omnitrophota bacterium]